MIKYILIPSALIIVSPWASTWAASGQETSLLLDQPTKVLQNEQIILKPVSGHHFNLKAPQNCGKYAWTEKTPRSLKCQLKALGVHEFLISICDDVESFCRQERFKVEAIPGAKQKDSSNTSRSTVKNELASGVHYYPKTLRPVPKGFIQNDSLKALAEAKKKKALLLIDFFGIWCPPCNMLDELVFDKEEFQNSAQNMVLLKLDADSDLSWKLKEKFRVGGYPTIVIANEKLQEISRLVGYRPVHLVAKWMDEARKLKDEPVEVLQRRIKKTPLKVTETDRLRVAHWLMERADYPGLINILKEMTVPEAVKLRLQAHLKLANQKGDHVLKKNVLEQLLTGFPKDVEFADWVLDYSASGIEEAKKFYSQALENLKAWRAQTESQSIDYTIGDLWQVEGALSEALGEKEQAEKAFGQAADFYDELAKKSSLEVARGANLEKAYCLLKAGKVEQSKLLYTLLSQHYSNEFTFNYNYAYALFELKEYLPASEYALKAEQNSYGDNWLRAVRLRARIDLGLGKKREVKIYVSQALAQAILPKSAQIRTHRYLSELRQTLKEAQK